MKTIVKQIKFDFTYDGVEYKGLDSGYTEEDNIDFDYIHSEDGPWFGMEFDDNVFDFQIFGDENGRLHIDVHKCILDDWGNVIEKEYLSKKCCVDNIVVDYATLNFD
jgi:hypothetical protein